MGSLRIELPDGSVKEMASGATPLDVARTIGERLAKDSIAARIDGELVDVTTPIEQDAKVADYSGPEEMNCMALVPTTGTSGALHIDWMNFVSYLSLKRHSDYQVQNNKLTHERYDSYTILEYDEGRKLMRVQTGPGGVAVLDISPKFLIVPAAHETTAKVLAAAEHDPA